MDVFFISSSTISSCVAVSTKAELCTYYLEICSGCAPPRFWSYIPVTDRYLKYITHEIYFTSRYYRNVTRNAVLVLFLLCYCFLALGPQSYKLTSSKNYKATAKSIHNTRYHSSEDTTNKHNLSLFSSRKISLSYAYINPSTSVLHCHNKSTLLTRTRYSKPSTSLIPPLQRANVYISLPFTQGSSTSCSSILSRWQLPSSLFFLQTQPRLLLRMQSRPPKQLLYVPSGHAFSTLGSQKTL
ncbi:hypothetical protein EDC01DRAFT_665427 [Geopyxis carbonaria]|nr:hypothetical protein EDC01DRAFT_665427 [Geopyxis carbonaria]